MGVGRTEASFEFWRLRWIAPQMLTDRLVASDRPFVFANDEGNVPRVRSLDHLHARIRKACKLSSEFVLHSLRHTYLTRLGIAGVVAFTIMKLGGHGSATVSQRYVHPTPRRWKMPLPNWTI